MTMEPILKFDLGIIKQWAMALKPEVIFTGFDSKHQYPLPEPSLSEVQDLHTEVQNLGIRIYDKKDFKYRDVYDMILSCQS